jgi:hypothetical protein
MPKSQNLDHTSQHQGTARMFDEVPATTFIGTAGWSVPKIYAETFPPPSKIDI